MIARFPHVVRLVGLTAVLLGLGCRPQYPVCEADGDCAGQQEVCVNRQCQQCRDDGQCGQAQPMTCVGGRCELRVEAPDECTEADDCPAGKKCEARQCVAQCAVDVDCGPAHRCTNGSCERFDAAGLAAAACRGVADPSSAALALDAIRFDFDRDELSPAARGELERAAPCLQAAAGVAVVIEGHADERGTQEYNLALGDKRASNVKAYLVHLGVNGARVSTTSKGENEPLCAASSEGCWAENRRVELEGRRGM